MKRSNTYKAVLGVFGLVLLFAYQNCSKVLSNGIAIQDNELSAGATTDGDVSSVTDLPVNPGVPGSEIDPISQSNPGDPGSVSHVDPGTVVTPPTTPPGSNTSAGPVVVPGGTITLPAPAPGGTTTLPAPGSDTTAEAQAAIKMCQQAEHLPVEQDLFVAHFNGELVSVAQNVRMVDHVKGVVVLRAATSTATLSHVNQVDPANPAQSDLSLVVCGFQNAKLITNVTGHVILVDSHVEMLVNHTGRLTLVNSTIDKSVHQGGGVVNVYSRQ